MYYFLIRTFNIRSICKILIIFVVGFISRFFVNYIFDTNVFKDFTSIVSLFYYSGFACFLYLLGSLVDSCDYFKMPLGNSGPIYPSDTKLSNVSSMNIYNPGSGSTSNNNEGLIVNTIANRDRDPTGLNELEKKIVENKNLGSKAKGDMLESLRKVHLGRSESSNEADRYKLQLEQLYLKFIKCIDLQNNVTEESKSKEKRIVRDIINNYELYRRENNIQKSDSANLADYLNKSKHNINSDNRQRSNTYSGPASNTELNFNSPPAPDRSKNFVAKGKDTVKKLFK